MAFNKSPVQSTYSTERVQLTREINTRTGGLVTKDEDFLNVIIEVEKNKQAQDNRSFVLKRAGSSLLVTPAASGQVRGMHYWQDQDKLFYCVGTNLYIYVIGSGSTTTLSSAFGTSSGVVGFTEFLYDDGTVKIVATDGTTLITVDSSNTKVVCADADLPSPHLPYPVFVDGYLMLAKANTADVYNSDLNDPLVWTVGNYVSAEMEPDKVVRIAKLNNYVIIFGTESVEYFWDAANTSGSPFQRNDTPIKLNTYVAGFAQYGNRIYYIGKNVGGQLDVFALEDFKIDNIGSTSISRYFNAQSTTFSSWYCGILAIQGHTFYIMNVGNYTYTYDLETKLWTRWAWQATTSFPIANTVACTTTSAARPFFTLGTSSSIYYLNEAVFQDNGTNFTSQVVTEASDFGTMNRKTMKRLAVIGDRPPSSGIVKLSWSDDDYKTFSSIRDVEMDQDLPCTYNLGSFRQRIFKLAYTNNSLWRVQGLEVDINKGNS